MIPRIWITPSRPSKPVRLFCPYTRLLIVCFILGVLRTVTASASDIEASATGGLGRVDGRIDGEDMTPQWATLLGASFKFRAGSPEIKFDYEHLNWKDRPANLHMIGVGWLIQFRSAAMRPFVQLGWTFGIERSHFEGFVAPGGVPLPNNPPIFVSVTTTNKFQGLAVSGGITKTFNQGFFIRPELRWRLIGPGRVMLTVPAITAGHSF